MKLLSRWIGCLVVAATLAHAADTEWSLVWADEFDQGQRPDPIRWAFDLGGNGWGNNELQTYTARTNNARIEDGHLVVEAHRERFTGADGKAREFTSARLTTKDRASWTYGRIEARLRLPRGQGIWPAFWLLGADHDSAGWPRCGEIDVMENIGREPGEIHGTIHGPGYAGNAAIGKAFKLSDGRTFADDFHVFAAEWTTNRIRWLVDGQPYFTVTPTNLPAGKAWVFDHPHYLLLNVAVGGHWPGSPDATTSFPQQMLVDYVRVYAPTNRVAPR